MRVLSRIKKIIPILIFLFPLTIYSISLNYSYATSFFIYNVKKQKIYNPIILTYGVFLLLSYGIGLYLIVPNDGYSLIRQFLGLGTSIIVFSLLFVDLNYTEEDLFYATYVCSFIYILIAIYYIVTDPSLSVYDPLGLKSGMRDHVMDWPQRYVIIMMCGFFYLLDDLYTNKKNFLPFIVLLAGIVLTFTRAAYISVLCGFVSYILFVTLNDIIKNRKKGSKSLWYVSYTFLFLFITVSGFEYYAGMLEVMYILWERIYNPVNAILFEGEIVGSSTRVRIKYWGYSLEVATKNIITGTGSAGVHLFKDTGSTHNQYLDVLLRTGLIGLIYYMYFSVRIMKEYIFSKPFIPSLIVSWSVYGIFHETTALSYGSFVFFSLVSKSFDKEY